MTCSWFTGCHYQKIVCSTTSCHIFLMILNTPSEQGVLTDIFGGYSFAPLQASKAQVPYRHLFVVIFHKDQTTVARNLGLNVKTLKGLHKWEWLSCMSRTFCTLCKGRRLFRGNISPLSLYCYLVNNLAHPKYLTTTGPPQLLCETSSYFRTFEGAQILALANS